MLLNLARATLAPGGPILARCALIRRIQDGRAKRLARERVIQVKHHVWVVLCRGCISAAGLSKMPLHSLTRLSLIMCLPRDKGLNTI